MILPPSAIRPRFNSNGSTGSQVASKPMPRRGCVMRHERINQPDPPSYRDGEGAGFRQHSEASKDGARAANPKRPTKCDLYFALVEPRGEIGRASWRERVCQYG